MSGVQAANSILGLPRWTGVTGEWRSGGRCLRRVGAGNQWLPVDQRSPVEHDGSS